MDKLKNERDQVTDQFLREKEALVQFEKEMDQLKAEEEYLQSTIVEKQEALTEMEQMIRESENAYNRVKYNFFEIFLSCLITARNFYRPWTQKLTIFVRGSDN